MICNQCKAGKHVDCPNLLHGLKEVHQAVVPNLSREYERIQREGQCPCQHRSVVLSDD